VTKEAGSDTRFCGRSLTRTAPSSKVVAAVLVFALYVVECSDRDGDKAGIASSDRLSLHGASPWRSLATRFKIGNLMGDSSTKFVLVVMRGSRVEKHFRLFGFTAAKMCSDMICAQSS